MNTTTSVPTDSPQKITVESRLIYILWLQGRAYAGFEAEFEVKTLLVGDGGVVKVTCRTEKGKKLDKIAGVMVLNRFRGKVLIPESVKPDDFIYLEVELPKHHLSDESNRIPVRPPVEVSSMTWSKQEIHRDEEVTMTCNFTNGVEDGDTVSVEVLEYDSAGIFTKVVTIPTTVTAMKIELNWQFIFQDDTNDIPTDKELKKYGKSYTQPCYFFIVKVDTISIGMKQESGLLKFLDWVEISLSDNEGEPCPDIKGSLTLADGSRKDFTLDDQGAHKLEEIVPGPISITFEDIPKVTIAGTAGDEAKPVEPADDGSVAVITTGESFQFQLYPYKLSV